MNSASKIGLLVIIGLLTGLFSNAQILPDPVSIIVTPQSPSPGEEITIFAKTPTSDPQTTTFQWTVNGSFRSDLSGRGKNSFTATAGDVGSVIRVAVSISRAEKEGGSASATIYVSDLALTWSAETYTPPWYAGKALPIQDSVVRIVAVPEVVISGTRADPANLIYRWSFGNKKDALVGIGENVFFIRTSLLPKNSHRVEIMVEDIKKRVQKTGRIFIDSKTPRAVIYKTSPLGGIEPRSAVSLFSTLQRSFFDFFAEPFFFPVSSKKSLLYQWNVAGSEPAGIPDNPHILTVDSENQPAGIVPISVTVNDTNDFTPSASRAFTLFLQ